MKENGSFKREKKFHSLSVLDLIECLKQIQEQRLILPCVPELPPNISTMGEIEACEVNIAMFVAVKSWKLFLHHLQLFWEKILQQMTFSLIKMSKPKNCNYCNFWF